jgi:hypothetical protein
MLIFDNQRYTGQGVYYPQVFVASFPVAVVFPGQYSVRVSASATFSASANVRQLAAAVFAGQNAVRILVSATFSAGYVVTQPSPEAPMTFMPSPARTVSVSATDATKPFIVGTFWNMSNPKTPKGRKDPGAVIDISFDWSAYLADVGDTVTEVAFLLTGDLVQVGKWITGGTLCTVLVSGGTVGQASITCRITTTSLPVRIDERTVFLKIEEL